MNLSLFIAKRYLVSKKSHNAINIISGVSVLVIALVTMALVVVLSVFNGFSDLIKSMYNAVSPDLVITARYGKTFDKNSPEISALKKHNGIIAYSAVIEGNALLKYNDKQCITTLKGIENIAASVSGADSIIKEGTFDISKNNIVISKKVEYKLNYGAGGSYTPLSIYVPKRGKIDTYDTEGGLNELKNFVSGIFSANDDFDKYAIISLENAKTLFGYTNEITSLELQLSDDHNKNDVQQELQNLLGQKYVIKNKEQQNALLYKTMQSEKLWTFIILLFILIVAIFNVIASLTMLIIEKKKDIAVLYYMGANTQLVRKIFVIEGLLITSIGAITGLLMGTFICWLQIEYGLITLTEGFLINSYPVKIKADDLLLVFSTVMCIGFIAAWYPVKVYTSAKSIKQ